MKNTKRALLTSVLALVMCVVMLVGSTFAWFTDSAVSYNNKIVAGKLDIQLFYHYLDADNVEHVVEITNESDPIFGNENSIVAQETNEDTLWEPGKTQAAFLEIKNNGNLALKYQVAIEVRNDAKDLYEVMQYTVVPDAKAADGIDKWADLDTEKKTATVGMNAADAMDVSLGKGESDFFALAIHMLEEAGNEYQEGAVSFDIKVLATQDTVEADYYDKFYDEDAAYPVVTVAELEAAIAAGEPIIALADDITVAETIAVENDLTINLQGYSLNATKTAGRALKVTADDVDLVINAEGAESTFGNGTYGVIELAANVKNANVTVNGGTFTGTTDAGAFIKLRDGVSGTITLNNVNYKDNYVTPELTNVYATVMGVSKMKADVNVFVNGGTYEAATGFVFNGGVDKAVFNDVTLKTQGYGYYFGGNDVDINGGTVNIGGTRLDSGMPTTAFFACNEANIEINGTTVTCGDNRYDHVAFVANSGGVITATDISVKKHGNISDYKVLASTYAGIETGAIYVNGVQKA